MSYLSTFSAVDTIWVLLGAMLVFFMQAGFAMVETGFTRAKNAGNIIMKNLVDFSLGSILFWCVGFGIMFGDSLGGIMGIPSFFAGVIGGEVITPDNIEPMVFLIFQTVFCATSATIVSGAMAERTKFSSYCVYSAILSMLVYPVSGHWIWGGGWLSQLGFIDFAGSTAVHMVGGIAALIGAYMVGPRIGKYTKEGKSKAILGHSLPLGALGVFILWFAWFGFNGTSTLGVEGVEDSIGNIFVTTNIAAAVSTVVVIAITWIKYKKPDVSMALNGALGGLVAITAGCDAVDPFGAAIIGIMAGFIIVYGIEFVDKVLKIDDPVGAVGVHGMCGAAGTIVVGLLAVDGGLFYTGSWYLLGVQTLGVVAVAAWVAVTMTLVFFLIKKTMGLRVPDEVQIAGLDIAEHGLESSYADFTAVPTHYVTEKTVAGVATMSEAVEVENTVSDGSKLSKLVVVCNSNRFETLKSALEGVGVTGMTVTHVMGCGIQKGQTEFYRGVATEMQLLPKVKVEVVVSKVPVETVVSAAKQALYTGHMGDGKIFIYDVEDVIKISTNQAGYDALQDN